MLAGSWDDLATLRLEKSCMGLLLLVGDDVVVVVVVGFGFGVLSRPRSAR